MKFDPNVYIKLWIDNTSKYGMVYILINGIIGVNFNDGIGILCNLETESVILIKPIDKSDKFIKKHYTKDQIPNELTIKMPIIIDLKKSLRDQWYK